MGTHYNYFRDYDPAIGRYIESDPIGLGGGLNTYAYVGVNPLTRIDATGQVGVDSRDTAVGDPTPADTSPCAYYDKLCKQTGCRYYCQTAPTICRKPKEVFKDLRNSQLNCIRVCLKDEDQAARGGAGGAGGSASGSGGACPRCLSDNTIDTYHRKCFTQCGVSTDRYPGVNPWWLPFNPNRQ